DCGSMLVGLVVGVLAITSSLKGPATVALATPAALMVIPIMDTLMAFLRRKLTGRSIYAADRGHLHHCLLRRGLSNRGALLVVCFLCLLTVLGALGTMALNNESLAIASALAVAVLLILTRVFGHAELLLVKQRLKGLVVSFLRVPSRGPAHHMEVRLQGSADWQELWKSLKVCAEQMGLNSVWLDVNAPFLHEGYHARWDRSEDDSAVPRLWRADVALVVEGRLGGRRGVSGLRNGEPVGEKLLRVAQLAEEVEQ